MTETALAIQVHVDTDRGTRLGVPNLLSLFEELGLRATFLFSLGPDNTGRAIRRIFRPGFFRKVSRTSVVSVYGIRTLMNGVLLPGPHVGRRNEGIMREARARGHEVGIHCYDHIRWQDGLSRMSAQEVRQEFGKARREFERIFGEPAKTAGAAGWQSNADSLAAYDEAGLLYASDVRGTHPFYPRAEGAVFRTIQVPTTLPTLDELLGMPEHPLSSIPAYFLSLILPGRLNVLTVHAELEGMRYLPLFRDLLERAGAGHIRVLPLRDAVVGIISDPSGIPVCDLVPGTVAGRSGTVSVQRCD